MGSRPAELGIVRRTTSRPKTRKPMVLLIGGKTHIGGVGAGACPEQVATSLESNWGRLLNSSTEVLHWDTAQLTTYNERARRDGRPLLDAQRSTPIGERWASAEEFPGSGPTLNLLNEMRCGDITRPFPPALRWQHSYVTHGLRGRDDQICKIAVAKRGMGASPSHKHQGVYHYHAVGRKAWWLSGAVMPPEGQRRCSGDGMDPSWMCVVEPNDVLYVPADTYHSTCALDEGLTFGFVWSDGISYGGK